MTDTLPSPQIPKHVAELRAENAVLREGVQQLAGLTNVAPGTTAPQVVGWVRGWADRILREAEQAKEAA